MDNYYNSVDLARQHIERNTYCIGTLRNGRKRNPSEVTQSKLKSVESLQFYSRHICVGKWKDKRQVLYISIEHENVFRDVTSSLGKTTIAEYNNSALTRKFK